MSILEAVRDDAASWPGSQESLSKDVCGSPHGLRHKLSGYKGARVSIEDVLVIMQLTGGRNTIKELCRELSGVFVELPPPHEEVDNTDLLAESQAITICVGNLFDAVNHAVTKHNEIDELLRTQIERRSVELREQVVRYVTLLMMVYGKPVRPEKSSSDS